tara:strand:+ start:553 stop:840 length:288 start_codon:yes stop_codon:yes gene_type:complete
MRKLSNKSYKSTLKRYKKRYDDMSLSPVLYDSYEKRIRLLRVVLGYETLIKCIDRLNWVIDTEFADGDAFKKERYDDWNDRIAKAKDHIAWVKAR